MAVAAGGSESGYGDGGDGREWWRRWRLRDSTGGDDDVRNGRGRWWWWRREAAAACHGRGYGNFIIPALKSQFAVSSANIFGEYHLVRPTKPFQKIILRDRWR